MPLLLRLGVLFGVALACLAVYLVLILARPLQVPVIAITAPAYPQPFPPNGWAEEDVQGLAALDGATITLHDARGAVRTRTAILDLLQDRLDDAARENPHGPVVIYFNLHAAVDGSGRPCLVPPGSSAADSSTWLPIEQVLSAIASHARSDDGDVLVVFDTNRLEVAWQLGVVRNTFVERLETLLNAPDGPRRKIPSLAVMTAAGVDEVSHTSPELGGSAFGHFLKLGLAGRADRSEIGGNGDSRVGLRELHAYLADAVSNWSRRNRDSLQSPVLIADDGVDFPITWVCRTKLPAQTAPRRAVSATTIAELWQRAERLERFKPIRYAPLVWTQIRRTLLYLEQTAAAGAGYAAVARTTAEELDSQLARFERQAAAPAVDRWNIFRTDDGTAPVAVPANSLALLRSFGRLDASGSAAWDAALGEISAAKLVPLADEIDLAESGPVNEAHFLRLLAQSPATTAAPSRLGNVVALHRLGEAAAAPADERAWPWIREQIVRGDAARRLVEDAAMAAAPADPTAYETAESIYRQAIETSSSVSESSRLLDLVLAEQIDLARWLTDSRHRLSDGERREHLTELVNTALLPMINETRRLAQSLNAPVPNGEPGIAARSQTIRTHFQTLRAEFDRAYARLLDAPPGTAATLREIDLLLSIPLLPSESRQSLSPAEQRSVLARRRTEIAQDLAATGTQDEPDNTIPAEPLRQMASRWETHPLAAIVEGALSSETAMPQSISDPQDAERIGQLTRSWLEGLAQSRPSIIASPRNSSPTDDDAPVPAEHPAGSAAELRARVAQLRTAASLRDFDEASPADAVVRLTDLNLATLLVGQAQRKLADFWGPTDPEQAPYFLAAADDLQAAAALGGFDRSIASSVSDSNRSLELRRQAALAGIRVDVSDVLQTTPDRDATAVVDVQAGEAPAGGAVPQGTAAVVVGRPGRWNLTEPMSLRVPVADQIDDIELDIAASGSEESQATARVGVLFRGNLFDAPLMTSAPSGPTVAFVTPEEAPTTLTLRSTHRQGLSVVFVLDCSASMTAAAPSEGFAGASNRLDLARAALSRMLAELATRPNTRVGVVFYGHRVGWRKVAAEEEGGSDRFQRTVQPDYLRTVPDAVMPYNDVELVEPLGRFDGAVAGEVDAMLESLRPWGETPLYLAIDEALQQFSDDDASAERSVIVITDGLNEQSNPSPAARRTLADVLSTWEQRKAAIEIIGFGLSEGDAGQAAAEFGQLAEATGGSYESARQATELIAALERRIGPATYRVRPSEGGDGVSTAVGTALSLSELAALPSMFQVGLDGQQVQVRANGGEALELLAGEAGPILSARYQTGSPRFVPLVSGDADGRSGVLLGLHRPLRTDDGGVTFEFSLQNEDQSFRARPASVWIEVTPLNDGIAAAVPYVFYHNRYVPRTPVPVLRWTAANWPAEAQSAQVRFWCRDRANDPVAVIPLAKLLQQKSATTIPGLEHVELEAYAIEEAGGLRIDVVERHRAGSPGVGRIAVTCNQPFVPREFVHQFDAEHGLVLHTLLFDGTGAEEALNRTSLVVSTRAAIEAGGLRLDPPAVVDVSDRADLLVPFRSPYASDDGSAGTASPAGTTPPAGEDAGQNAVPLLKAPGPE